MQAAKNKRSLAAIVGATAVAVLYAFTPTNEGRVKTTYRDIGGVLTYCDGATENAQWVKTYSNEECNAQLDRDLARHAEGISQCVNMEKLTVGQRVAFVDTAFNIGVSAFCGSSMARKANQGDLVGSCDSLMMWVNVGGKPVRGLINRREKARAICLGVKS